PLLRTALPGLRRRRAAMGVGAVAARVPRSPRAPVPHRRTRGPRRRTAAVRTTRGTARRTADRFGSVALPLGTRRALAGARVSRPAFALPPEGGRSAGLGDPPAARPLPGGLRGDRVRRIRRRSSPAHALAAVREDDARHVPRHRLRRLPGLGA